MAHIFLPLRARTVPALLCIAGATWVALSAPPQAHAQVLRCTDARTGAVSYTDGVCKTGSEVQEVEPRRSEADIERGRAQAAEALARKQQRLQNDLAATRLQAERDAQRAQQYQQQQQQRAPEADPARSPECASARRQLEATSARPGSGAADPRLLAAQQQMELVCLGAARYAELEKDRAARQPGVVFAPPVWSPSYPTYPGHPVYPTYPGHPVHPPHTRPPPPAPPPPRFTHCNVFRCYDAQGRSYSRP